MSDDAISGMCIVRALRHKMTILDTVQVLYEEFLVPDRFYTREERNEIFYEILDQVDLDGEYTLKDFELAIQKEMRMRDRTPQPRDYIERPSEDQGSFIMPDDINTSFTENFSGQLILKVLGIFMFPSKIETMQKKKILEPSKKYSTEVLKKVIPHMRHKNMDLGLLCAAFNCFLEVPDIQVYLGEEVPFKYSTIHNHSYYPKLTRIRLEVLIAQRKSAAYVAKFFDVVLERVVEDHYVFEAAYFEKRTALVDRLQQLPTAKKSKGHAKHEFLTFNQRKRFKIDLDVLGTVHPFLKERIGTATGKGFQESFLKHLESTFPDKSNTKPSKSALVFAEKFFIWAAVTLEFEKELVEPVKSTYTFSLTPYDKRIPLRVLHMPAPNTAVKRLPMMFVDEIRQALRKYQEVYGDLEIEIPPPHHPGPSPMIVQFVAAMIFEDELRRLTKNRIIFDLVPAVLFPLMPQWYPILGPFNRHVISPQFIFYDIMCILEEELKIGFKLDPAHPEVAAFGERMTDFFAYGVKRASMVDLEAAMSLKWQAHSLKKFQVESSPSSHQFLALHCNVVQLIGHSDEAIEFLRRVIMVEAFPKIGDLIHMLDCTGNLCCKSFLPDFKPTYGPVTREEQQRLIYPQLMCNAAADRQMDFINLEAVLQ